MRIVGLTGGIACGKSTVSRELSSRHGLHIIDADALAKQTTKVGAWGYRRVVRAFASSSSSTPSILVPSTKELDRDALARLVFADPAARRRLNAATHPPVALALALSLLKNWLLLRPLVVVDMPLLFESGFARFCSANIVVSADEEEQLRRLKQRDGIGEEAGRARIAAQMPAGERERRATVVIRNDRGTTLEALRGRVGLLARDRRGALRPAWGWAVATWPPTLVLVGWGLWRLAAAAGGVAVAGLAAGRRR